MHTVRELAEIIVGNAQAEIRQWSHFLNEDGSETFWAAIEIKNYGQMEDIIPFDLIVKSDGRRFVAKQHQRNSDPSGIILAQVWWVGTIDKDKMQ